MPNPDMPAASPADLIAAQNAVAFAAHALNVAMRKAAELDLEVSLEAYLQDLEDDSLARAGNAPAVEVRVSRYAEGEAAPG